MSAEGSLSRNESKCFNDLLEALHHMNFILFFGCLLPVSILSACHIIIIARTAYTK